MKRGLNIDDSSKMSRLYLFKRQGWKHCSIWVGKRLLINKRGIFLLSGRNWIDCDDTLSMNRERKRMSTAANCAEWSL